MTFCKYLGQILQIYPGGTHLPASSSPDLVLCVVEYRGPNQSRHCPCRVPKYICTLLCCTPKPCFTCKGHKSSLLKSGILPAEKTIRQSLQVECRVGDTTMNCKFLHDSLEPGPPENKAFVAWVGDAGSSQGR